MKLIITSKNQEVILFVETAVHVVIWSGYFHAPK
jgi:hypothetical protein